MSSLLSEFKQIPVNAGYYVCCVSGATSSTWNVSGDGTLGTVIVTAPVLGAQYIDLGVTRVVRNGTPVNTAVYRKVVPVSIPLDINAAELFIRVGGATAAFARMG